MIAVATAEIDLPNWLSVLLLRSLSERSDTKRGSIRAPVGARSGRYEPVILRSVFERDLGFECRWPLAYWVYDGADGCDSGAGGHVGRAH